VRLVTKCGAGVERTFKATLTGAFREGTHGFIRTCDHIGHLHVAIPKRPTGFAGDMVDQRLLGGADSIGKPTHRLDAERERHGCPSRPTTRDLLNLS